MNEDFEKRIAEMWCHAEQPGHVGNRQRYLLSLCRRIDGDYIDGVLTEEALQKAESIVFDSKPHRYIDDKGNPRLFGDYELLIDGIFGGDKAIKKAVMDRDRKNGRGFMSIKHFLKERKLTCPPALAPIWASCEADMDTGDIMPDKVKNIEFLRGGSFRVKVMVDGKRIVRTFSTLDAAIEARDKLLSGTEDPPK